MTRRRRRCRRCLWWADHEPHCHFLLIKGGVGRTFALANIAVLLAQRGHRVLIIDWDLEAPGLHRFFQSYLPEIAPSAQGLAFLLQEAIETADTDWRKHVVDIELGESAKLSLLPSGDQCANYADCVRKSIGQSSSVIMEVGQQSSNGARSGKNHSTSCL